MIEGSDEAMMRTAGDAARSKRVDDVRRRGRRSLILETQTSYTQTEVYGQFVVLDCPTNCSCFLYLILNMLK